MIGVGIGIVRKRAFADYYKRGQMSLASTGDGSGVSTLRLQVSANTTVMLEGDANFYTDAAGTLNESKTWTITAGALRTIYIKMTGASKTAVLNIPNRLLLIRFGTDATDGWTSATNAARLTFTPSQFVNVTQLRITGTTTIIGALPTGLTYLRLAGDLINWTYKGALPTGLTVLQFVGAQINWTYEGALPTGLTSLVFIGSLINWTALDASGNGNITTFNLTNHRDLKMSDAELVTLLTSMINRVGALPDTCLIGDYLNFAAPPQSVTDAIAALKVAKPNITTVTLSV
jgi:hypothetical protein